MDDTTRQLDALMKAIDELGSQAALSRLLSVAQPSVWGWVHRMKRLPAERVLQVEAATGVSRHDLRPDIYPIETPAAATGGAPAAAMQTPAVGAHTSDLSRKGLDTPSPVPPRAGDGAPLPSPDCPSTGVSPADPSCGLPADFPHEGCVSGWQA